MKFFENSFFSKDKKEYELENNPEFVIWLVTSIESGTKCNRYIKLSDMQGLINHLNDFYYFF